MSADSEDDPYGGDDSDVDHEYRPMETTEESSEDSEVGEPNLNKSRGRKRLRKQSEWNRSIQKVRRTAGKQYVSTSKVVVPARVMGNACNCKLKCFDNIPAITRQKIFDDFNKLPSKELQDSYLCRNIALKDVSRRRPRTNQSNKPKTVTSIFSVSTLYICHSNPS